MLFCHINLYSLGEILHAELASDEQRVAAPRYAYQYSVGRRERRAVEFHARGLYAVGGKRVALYRIVVRRREHQRPALAQPVEQRDAERRALLGVRARAELVEHDERARRNPVEYLRDVRDVRAEG